jgi:hypothetical protein
MGSGADPHGVVSTGMPDASASIIITLPNGSGQAIGLRRQRARHRVEFVHAADFTDVLHGTAQERCTWRSK